MIKIIYLITILTIISSRGIAQPEINGAGCIIPGTTYQYMITGRFDPSSNARLCIRGGTLQTGDSCISLQTTSMILVIWNGNVAERTIAVNSDMGIVSLMVTGTSELYGGAIADSDKVKIFNADQFNYIFHCADATGGACHPNYTYQWQSSTNQLNWTNIQNAKGKNLQYSGTISTSTFFRRITIETHSNIVAYSDSGQLMIVYN